MTATGGSRAQAEGQRDIGAEPLCRERPSEQLRRRQPSEAIGCDVDLASLAAVREAADREGRRHGLSDRAVDDLVLAANELATNVVRHGGGVGRMWLWPDGGWVLCRMTDHGPGMPAADHAGDGPPGPDAIAGRGLWMIRRFTGGMLIETGPTGTTVTVAVAV